MTLKEAQSEDGGCQVYGRLSLNRVSGHFHIAPHRKLRDQPANKNAALNGLPGGGIFSLLDLISFTFDQFNVSHTVNSLSFGEHFPGIKSPLDGQTRNVLDTHGMHQYYIKVVPTRFVPPATGGLQWKEEVQSNQYSVTEHMSHLAPGSGRGLPGVYFYYEVSPITARIEHRTRPMLGFVTSLCALVGGAFSLMGLVDLMLTALFHYTKRSIL